MERSSYIYDGLDYLPNLNKYADISKVFTANYDGYRTIVYCYSQNRCLEITRNIDLLQSEVEKIEPFTDYVLRSGLGAILKRTNGETFSELPIYRLKQIDRIVGNKLASEPEYEKQVKIISQLSANYISDLLGFNIATNPSSDLVNTDTPNVLIKGVKLKRFKEALTSLIEFELYDISNRFGDVIITCDKDGIDYRIKGALSQAKIQFDGTRRFKLKINDSHIMIKQGDLEYVTYYDKKDTKVKKLV